MKLKALTHEFVENIPEVIDDGILYISIPYTTAVHLCCCGCGLEVVTPFSSTDWELNFNGDSVSLSPSIGNWSFPCRSHYWITRNSVNWASDMSSSRIKEIRMQDRVAKEKQYVKKSQSQKLEIPISQPIPKETTEQPSIFKRLWNSINSICK
ncbi:DUF6527 family protein [Cocleimonas sp. KMM 6892]|uniref:DUF6527 family protein n=1 Tax=unclassified Cocleimonas TaxID=2639732 RepID=UPI002DB88D87|nr:MULTISPECIES: DUF6527 family protein [unclassified Cocleimonas]MEB8432588.1 DUF6527 family protein [Cocleimonas sp. KMM 6892]MEC4715447.1 DUF6527 family protein [Cocleimonas sp. KMM 6895]MEC4744934.1 DUF6527 family protein [Cocleimonas sp. KMM 6896]